MYVAVHKVMVSSSHMRMHQHKLYIERFNHMFRGLKQYTFHLRTTGLIDRPAVSHIALPHAHQNFGWLLEKPPERSSVMQRLDERKVKHPGPRCQGFTDFWTILSFSIRHNGAASKRLQAAVPGNTLRLQTYEPCVTGHRYTRQP